MSDVHPIVAERADRALKAWLEDEKRRLEALARGAQRRHLDGGAAGEVTMRQRELAAARLPILDRSAGGARQSNSRSPDTSPKTKREISLMHYLSAGEAKRWSVAKSRWVKDPTKPPPRLELRPGRSARIVLHQRQRTRPRRTTFRPMAPTKTKRTRRRQVQGRPTRSREAPGYEHENAAPGQGARRLGKNHEAQTDTTFAAVRQGGQP